MKAFQESGARQFAQQTDGKPTVDGALPSVTLLSFVQCALSAELFAAQGPKLTQLERLSLVGMKPSLTDASLGAILAALPAPQKLVALDVSDNKVASLPAGTAYPALRRLLMCNNAVRSFAALGVTAERCPALRTLDLDDNESVTKRELAAVWAALPALQVLNGLGRDGEPMHVSSSDDSDDDDFTFDGEEGEEEQEGDADDFVADEDDDDGAVVANAPPNEAPRRRERDQ